MLEKFEQIFNDLKQNDDLEEEALSYIVDVLTEFIPWVLENNRNEFERSTILYVCFNKNDLGLSIRHAKYNANSNFVDFMENNRKAFEKFNEFCQNKGYKEYSNYYIINALKKLSFEAENSEFIEEITATETEMTIILDNPVYRSYKF